MQKLVVRIAYSSSSNNYIGSLPGELASNQTNAISQNDIYFTSLSRVLFVSAALFFYIRFNQLFFFVLTQCLSMQWKFQLFSSETTSTFKTVTITICLTKVAIHFSHICKSGKNCRSFHCIFFYCHFEYNVWLKRNEIEYNSFDSAIFLCSLLVCACHAFSMQLSHTE